VSRLLILLFGVAVLQISDLKSQISDSKEPLTPALSPEYGSTELAEVRGEGGKALAGAVRFAAVDVFVDSGAQALAAYQFELKVTAGDVTLVGVEGGEHRAYRQPPYYDPAALTRQRIVIAAFDASGDLPRGKTRVARLMVRVRGDVVPVYDAKLVVAASPEAKAIDASISVSDTSVSTKPVSEGAGR
jgi:hypothetical protein